MSPELQTRAREWDDRVRLFYEMVTTATYDLNLEPQDLAAISRSTDWMSEELRASISDLTAHRADRDHIDGLQSLLEGLRSADELVQRKLAMVRTH